jgi:hypothetical protein
LTNGGVSGTPIASNLVFLSQTMDNYSQFSVPFIYVASDAPVTCVIHFSIVGPSTASPMPTIGSYYILDDLGFSGTTNVDSKRNSLPSKFKILQTRLIQILK